MLSKQDKQIRNTDDLYEKKEQKLIGKTIFCKHDNTCLKSCFYSFMKSFTIGFGVRSVITLLFSIKKLMKEPTQISTILLSRQNFQYGLFLSVYSLLFKGIICLLRHWLKKEHKLSAMLSGFIAGITAINFLNSSSRKTWALFLLARSFDSFYQSLINKGYIPKWKYDYVFLYSALMVITGYCYANQPDCMGKDLNNFYLRFTNQKIEDLQLRAVWIQQNNKKMIAKGYAPVNPLDHMPKLKKFYESQAKK